jgi:signal transduction histidine kinase/DNA-binding response OmpR family regulator
MQRGILPSSFDVAQIFPGDGEMAARIRALDWAATPLGPVETWPSGLRSAVRILLTSRYAMWMGWGPSLTFFYNDAYRPTLGLKNAWALGVSTRRVCAEVWPEIETRFASILATGRATWDEALLLFLERSGFPEETYHTFSYSPLADDDGAIAGILCVVTEETERVIGDRRLTTLRDLGSDLTGTNQIEAVREAIERNLGANPYDLPFALVYRFEDGATPLTATGAMPRRDAPPFDLTPLLHGAPRIVFEDPAASVAFVARDRGWMQAPRAAIAVPIARSGQHRPAGALVVGLNPFRPLDTAYTGFLDLVAGQIAAGLANATAYEEERRRTQALAELDRAKTVFFSNVSHEFRTPLTLMLGPLEELLAGRGGMQHDELLAVAHRNGLRLLKLVNTLLDFSRIEAGRADAHYRPTDLAALTADIASTFRSAMDRAGLHFTVDCPPLPQPVHVDREMWEKVVLNLLSNAFKFTFEGGVTVRLRTVDGSARLEVEDSGTGFPADQLPHLFERFYRGEVTQGRSFEGSGIGLAMVQELVRLHGGTVTARSRVGAGSVFTVEIPVGTAHLPPDRIDDDAAASAGRWGDADVEEALRCLPGEVAADKAPTWSGAEAWQAGSSAAGRRILLVDDNLDMLAYVQRMLAGSGYMVEVACDGAAALAAARRMQPDLVLSDVMMPKLDGFGLLHALRQDLSLQHVPVILLTARAGEESSVEGLDAGADDYLVKPFSARELLARVGATLHTARLRRAADAAVHEQAGLLDALNKVGTAVTAELDALRALQIVTDAATQLTGASFGAFLDHAADERDEDGMPYALSGMSREAFTGFLSCHAAMFAPTFSGQPTVCFADISADRHDGSDRGMSGEDGPIRSYLATPVVARSGETLGGLFFGHVEPGRFEARHAQLVEGIAKQAAIAIDNARLYGSVQESERKLRELNETLEQRISARTEELAAANRQLVAQIEERERVEATLTQMQRLEAVGQLTAGVAHDFNNLLTVISGSLEWLSRRLSDPPLVHRLEMMCAAADRGASLTAQLLAFSRRQRLAPKPTDLNGVVDEMRALLQSTIGRSLELSTALSPDLWPALVDPTQIELVILNLVINARDAMPVGGRLTVRTGNVACTAQPQRAGEPGPGAYAMIEVRDTGSGMSEEVLAKAFEPFFTTKEVGKGSGLGLAQVYGFAKQSGGGVRIETAPGHGTSVQVYLPRATSAATRGAAAQPDLRPRAGAGATILLVDDDDAVREVTGAMLQEMHYHVVTAGSGGAALDVLERRSDVALLVLDFAMPGMNGAELARRARALRPTLPIVFVTGYAELEALRAAGEAHVVQKPFRRGALATSVQQALEAGREGARKELHAPCA